MKLRSAILILVCISISLSACVSAATPTATFTPVPIIHTSTTATPLPSGTLPPTASITPSITPTALPSDTPTLLPSPTGTETLSEKLKNHIVFYLLIPEGKRRDACGNIKEVPIISQRIRTNDKLQDVQIALNMLFSVGRKFYGPYYNALWNTQFTIESTEYNAKKDYMTITFGGYFPFPTLSDCDKHGIRQQIWTTFFHYGFKEKTFKYYEKYLIDKLGGN